MKKLILFVIICLLIASVNVSAQPSICDSKIGISKTIFGEAGLNIVEDVNKDGYINRAEMAKIVYLLSDGGQYSLKEFGSYYNNNFNDVDENYWAYEYIESLRKAAIFSGDGNGNFNPEKPCKYIDFIKTVIFISGYSAYYNAKGYGETYYEKCYKVAQKMNLTLNEFTIDRYLTLDDVYLILFDMLFVPQICDVGFGFTTYDVYESSYNLLKLNYGIEMNLGYFNKNGENSFLSSDGGMIFNGEVFNDQKFQNGYAICFYKANYGMAETDIVLCVSVPQELYQECIEKYDKYKVESIRYDKYK